jgi:hypothetical protein
VIINKQFRRSARLAGGVHLSNPQDERVAHARST